MKTGETTFQIAAFAYCRRARPHAMWWSADAGQRHDGSQKATNILLRRKRRGLIAGVPDIHCMDAGLFIVFELKNPDGDGRLDDAQLDFRATLLRNGGHWFGPVTRIEQIEAALISVCRPPLCHTGATGVVPPQPSGRRLAAWAKMHDEVPNLEVSTS